MTDSNKARIVEFGKASALVLLGLIAIISGCGVWNAAAAGAVDAFYVVVSIINFICEGVGIYFLWRKFFKGNKE